MTSPETPPPSSEGDSIDLTITDDMDISSLVNEAAGRTIFPVLHEVVDLTCDWDEGDAKDAPSTPIKYERESLWSPVDLTLDDERNKVISLASDPESPVPRKRKKKTKTRTIGMEKSKLEMESEPAKQGSETADDDSEPPEGRRRLRSRVPRKKPDEDKDDENFFALRDSVKQLSAKQRRSVAQKLRNDKESTRCRNCRQPLATVMTFPSPPKDAVDEETALKDVTLQMSNRCLKKDELPQNKLTLFSVYDGEGHLCPLDGGCVERNEKLFISGYIKPIYSEDPSANDGIPVTDLGPILQWWMGGYDGGPNRLSGISTALGEYYLMNPSPSYSPLMEELVEKIQLGKCVIEYLTQEENASYEELLNHIQSAVSPSGEPFSEDTLLRHVQFVCDQVVSYDEAGYDDGDSDSEDDWRKLVSAPCMRTLICLAGGRVAGRGRITDDDYWRRDSDEEEEESDDDSDEDYKADDYRPNKRVISMSGKSKSCRIPQTRAVTTSLVSSIFNTVFVDELDTGNKSTNPTIELMPKNRCGTCKACRRRNCEDCVFCAMRIEFGDSGEKTLCIKRRCVNIGGFTPRLPNHHQSSDESSSSDDNDDEKSEAAKDEEKPEASDGPRIVEWIGDAIHSDESGFYFLKAQVGTFQVSVGDFIRSEGCTPNDSVIGRVVYLFEDDSKHKYIHMQNFVQGKETIIGDSANPYEIFAGDTCETTQFDGVLAVVTVQHKKVDFFEWQRGDGQVELQCPTEFFYTKRYDAILARFEDVLPEPPCPEGMTTCTFCPTCYAIMEKVNFSMPQTCDPLNAKAVSKGKAIEFSHVLWRGEKYSKGTCVYLSPEAFEFKKSTADMLVKLDYKAPKVYDEIKYPERYRKLLSKRRGNDTAPNPFCIGLITNIVSRKLGYNEPDDITLHLLKFYRPENTTDVVSDLYQLDLTMLFASNEAESVSFEQVQGLCYVAYGENLPGPDHSKWTFEGPDRFYFTHAYDDTFTILTEPTELFRALGASEKTGEGTEIPAWPEISRPLRCFDVFAGCGGLSDGLHKSGVAECKWAVEVVASAADAFKLNNPNATVFTMDCNNYLKNVIAGDTENSLGQKYPLKGEVEMLVGGPPCQGFSGLNRFNSGVYSSFKNSLVVSYLSFCDFYRPRYFILENVRNFVSFNKNMILKLTMRCLLEMGYQVTVAILQAGHYGVPQTRRRAIIIAAAPGEILPKYPEPRHVFHPKAGSLSFVLSGIKIDSGYTFRDSAPLRTITVYDAMSDLPHLENGDQELEIEYACEALTHFQKLVRQSNAGSKLRDHICKMMSPMVAARIRHVPLFRDADWRDLPNIEFFLEDGVKCNKLLYEYDHKYSGRSRTGELRGVCSCNEGGACDPMDRQSNTLIPWCMSHTANRNHNWAGLYGRLQWSDFFGTTVTNPEPMGKQGRVLHPVQHRVVSVKECARSQGFDDAYHFSGSILDKHRQVGNAVPPPMGKAIGLEIRKAIHQLENRRERE